MPSRLTRTLVLVWCFLVLCMLSCGDTPPEATGDPCILNRCDPDQGVLQTVCSPLDATVTTTIDKAAKFLYEGPSPLQAGIDPNALDPRRAAVLRGKITRNRSQPGSEPAILGDYFTPRRQGAKKEGLVREGGPALTSFASLRLGVILFFFFAGACRERLPYIKQTAAKALSAKHTSSSGASRNSSR